MSYSLRRRRVPMAVTAAAAALLLGLAGCGSSDSPATADPSTSAAPGTEQAGGDAASVLTVHDPWVKAAEGGMTAAFGALTNSGDVPVTVVSASTDISPVELHGTSAGHDGAMSMSQKEGGFVIEPNNGLALEPGGDHLMLMALSRPIRAGEEIVITLTLADGRTVEFTAVAKPFAGAQESYAPSHG
ncbi:copper chaperone PCu(A)C [Micromonosporaceae bacterium DT55]|uniref:copper chaperone PCu(A)C n=1 Tax=Melissospora conviva TaxID=3388432 RepID=UPI003C17DEA2